jgi:hypothetical protein
MKASLKNRKLNPKPFHLLIGVYLFMIVTGIIYRLYMMK